MQTKHTILEKIKRYIVETITALPQIPIKIGAKNRKYRLSLTCLFNYILYHERNNVECVNSIIKRKFKEILIRFNQNLRNKESKFKTTYYNSYRFINLMKK